MPYFFCCPNCHVERAAAPMVCGRRVRCPECFELVEAGHSDDLHYDLPSRDEASSDTVVLTELEVAAQPDGFDPYAQWLGIPENEQPANFYRLLDLPQFEPDSYVISGAADRQIAKIRAIDDEARRPTQQKLIDEINRARTCLSDPEQKPTYDRRLHKQLNRQAKAKAAETQAKDGLPDHTAPSSSENVGQVEEGDAPAPEGRPTPAGTHAPLETSEEDTVDEIDGTKIVPAEEEVLAGAAPPVKPKAAPSQAAPPVISSAKMVEDVLVMDQPAWREEKPQAAPMNAPVSFSRTRFEAEMDMTPMVDVTFLLLIFFMVTASFSLQKSIEQPVQKQDKPSTNVTMEEFEDNPDFVVVQIDEFDTFRVITAEFDEEAPSEQELLVKLRRARQGGGGQIPTKLLVAAHGDTSHGRVIMAMDAGTEVGMEQVQFTLAADSDL